jgi:hypothetical protein
MITEKKIYKISISKVSDLTNHSGANLSQFLWALKCGTHNITPMKTVYLKMFKCLCHIINYTQYKRGKHKELDHDYSNLSQQLTRALFSVANVDNIQSKCLTGGSY